MPEAESVEALVCVSAGETEGAAEVEGGLLPVEDDDIEVAPEALGVARGEAPRVLVAEKEGAIEAERDGAAEPLIEGKKDAEELADSAGDAERVDASDRVGLAVGVGVAAPAVALLVLDAERLVMELDERELTGETEVVELPVSVAVAAPVALEDAAGEVDAAALPL